MIRIFLAVASVCAVGASTGFAANSACHEADSGLCMESNNPHISIDCENGVVIDVCPTADRSGTCFFGTEEEGVMARFYSNFPGDAASECASSDGQWVAG